MPKTPEEIAAEEAAAEEARLAEEAKKEEEEVDEKDVSKLMSALKSEREARKAAEREAKDLKKKNETDTEKAIREAVEAATSTTEEKYKNFVVSAEAKIRLAKAGLTAAPERFVKMIDTSAVAVGDDGTIDGLDDQIASIKKDFSELFTGKKAPVGQLDTGEKPAPKSTPKTSAEKLASRLTSD